VLKVAKKPQVNDLAAFLNSLDAGVKMPQFDELHLCLQYQ